MIELSRIDPAKKGGGLALHDFLLLKKTPIFEDLSDDAVLACVADGHVRVFDRKTTLFVKGEPADRFYLILDGWVKLTRQSMDGSESVISVLTAGDTFAEAAMFSQGGFPVNAVVVEQSRLLVIPSTSVFRCLRENTEYALNIMGSMSRHMRRLVRQIEQLSVKSATERLAIFLLEMCDGKDGSVRLSLPIEKTLLAGRLGMQPETLSRSLAKLKEDGVETIGSDVEIKDLQVLRGKWLGRD